MADKKLSSVSAVSDMNYVYAETSSGETVKISKADLASVVAGIMPNSSLSKSGLMSQIQIKNIPAGGILEFKSSALFTPLFIIAIGVVNGGRAAYLISPAEYNTDNAQKPIVRKIGESWVNPISVYYKVDNNSNTLAISVGANATASLYFLGASTNSIEMKNISSTVGYTEISSITL